MWDPGAHDIVRYGRLPCEEGSKGSTDGESSTQIPFNLSSRPVDLSFPRILVTRVLVSGVVAQEAWVAGFSSLCRVSA